MGSGSEALALVGLSPANSTGGIFVLASSGLSPRPCRSVTLLSLCLPDSPYLSELYFHCLYSLPQVPPLCPWSRLAHGLAVSVFLELIFFWSSHLSNFPDTWELSVVFSSTPFSLDTPSISRSIYSYALNMISVGNPDSSSPGTIYWHRQGPVQ